MKQLAAIYIVADDLTGSADAANYFRTATRRVRVSFSPDSPWSPSLDNRVVQVFDAESRGLPLADAKQRMITAGQQLADSEDAFFIYKKVDSTLRGHIGGEIEGLLHGVNRRLAVLTPSFPDGGRIVQDGKLFVNGVPVSQTPIAKDPRNPVKFDRVADIVRQTTNLPVFEINHTVIEQGVEIVSDYLRRITHEKAVVIADALTDRHLAIIAKTLSQNLEFLPCGSAGLARQFAELWSPDASCNATNSRHTVCKPVCTQVIVAVGSANPISHEQLNNLTSLLGTPTITMEPRLLSEPSTYSDEIARVESEIEELLNSKVVALTLNKERAIRNPTLPGSFETDLAQLVLRWWQHRTNAASEMLGFVATGGDTALAICQALSALAIWPEGEVVTGIPWSWIETETGKFPLVTKAGGFGTMHALSQSVEFLLDTHEAHKQ